MRLVVVGSAKVADVVRGCVESPPWCITHLSDLKRAEGWLVAYHGDVIAVEERLLGYETGEELQQFFDSPFSSHSVFCVLSSEASPRDDSRLDRLKAWAFSLESDPESFTRFLSSLIRCGPRPICSGNLAGTLPTGGIRLILPILESEQRSGRVVVSQNGTENKQYVLWLRRGVPVLANDLSNGRGVALEVIAELSRGWFCFVDTNVDNGLLITAENWYRGSASPVQEDETAPGSAGPLKLRERFRELISSARSFREIEAVLNSFLDMGIDKAAEHEDTMLMDKLVDLSILLEKQDLGKARELLRELREGVDQSEE